MSLNPVIADVTARIVERSKDSRAAYLANMQRTIDSQPGRAKARPVSKATEGGEGTQATVTLDGATRSFAMPREGQTILDAAGAGPLEVLVEIGGRGVHLDNDFIVYVGHHRQPRRFQPFHRARQAVAGNRLNTVVNYKKAVSPFHGETSARPGVEDVINRFVTSGRENKRLAGQALRIR